MSNSKEARKLFNENVGHKSDCSLCIESGYEVGKKTGYGIVVCKAGSQKNGWFATLSPKTGGNPKVDFTVQLMPANHLTHLSQMESYPESGKNYGILFSKVCRAMTEIMMESGKLKSSSGDNGSSAPIATYGKCTTWKEKKEHLHVKIFPFRGDIGQPYTVDSSFEKKEIFMDKKTGESFVKMKPVRKMVLDSSRFDRLAKELIRLLNK